MLDETPRYTNYVLNENETDFLFFCNKSISLLHFHFSHFIIAYGSDGWCNFLWQFNYYVRNNQNYPNVLIVKKIRSLSPWDVTSPISNLSKPQICHSSSGTYLTKSYFTKHPKHIKILSIPHIRIYKLCLMI